MMYQSSEQLTSYAVKFETYSLGLLALVAVAASGPVQATLDKAAVVAAGSGAAVSETTAAVPDAASGEDKKANRIDPDWRPPSAPKVAITSPVDPEQAEKLAEQCGVKLISLLKGHQPHPGGKRVTADSRMERFIVE